MVRYSISRQVAAQDYLGFQHRAVHTRRNAAVPMASHMQHCQLRRLEPGGAVLSGLSEAPVAETYCFTKAALMTSGPTVRPCPVMSDRPVDEVASSRVVYESDLISGTGVS